MSNSELPHGETGQGNGRYFESSLRFPLVELYNL
jgi:hypothetical protein